MKVIGINDSDRKNGNTAVLIKMVFEPLNELGIETELIQLADGIVAPCRACFLCGGKNSCTLKNDLFAETFDKMIRADGIILGSPVYSANVSATMQAFLERAAVVCDMNPGLLKHKVRAAIVSLRHGEGLNAVDTMNHFFLNHE